MALFEDIQREARAEGLGLLVIGGLAVIFYGYARETVDLDLLVRQTERAAWLRLFGRLGYSVQTERNHFIQLSPAERGAWPVDLMLVSDETFKPMIEAGREVDIYGARLKIPTLEHLLALKLHSLKHGHIGRYAKDLLDVEALVRTNSLDMNSEKVRQLFLKYGTLKIYEQVSRFTAGE
jgi:predicted nucleotidyltransferase